MSLSEAVKEHPDLVRKHLGSVVPAADNFYSALNAAVFSDGSFVYVPKARTRRRGGEGGEGMVGRRVGA